MDQLFNDQVLQLTLKFSSPDQRGIEDADKRILAMSAGLKNIVRDSLAAGKSVTDLSSEMKALDRTLSAISRNAGRSGYDPGTVGQVQKLLGQYAPDRLDEVKRLSGLRASVAPETSGSVALRDALKRVADELEFNRRKQATQAGMFYPASGNSQTGRGLYLDTETAFIPGARRSSQQLVELGAVLFEFNKVTGQITNSAKQVYQAFQDVSSFSQRVQLPRGLTPSMLRGQAISPLVLGSMARQADFMIAHHAPFDRGVLTPQFGSIMNSRPWMDSMRDVPWRELGMPSRKLQDLLRVNNIDTGTAHRALSDAMAGVSLLGARSSIGGIPYMGMMLGAKGPVSRDQEFIQLVKQQALENQANIRRQLGEAPRYGFAEQYQRRRTFTGLTNFTPGMSKAGWNQTGPTHSGAEFEPGYGHSMGGDLYKQITMSVIEAIEGGPTAYGIRGSGGNPEATPQNIGASAIYLSRRLGINNEFLRNAQVLSSPSGASMLRNVLQSNAAYQEKIQQYAGRQQISKDDLRTGDDLMFATMRGVNTQLRNLREGSYFESVSANVTVRDREKEAQQRFVRRMLQSREITRDRRTFSDEEVNSFLGKHGPDPTGAPAKLALQMASHVGESDPRHGLLAGIALKSQESAGPKGQGDSFIMNAFKRFIKEEEGSFNLPQFTSLFSGAGRRAQSILGSVFGSSAADVRNIGIDPRDELKGLRREDSINRMYAAAERAAKKLEDFEQSINPKNRAAVERFELANMHAAEMGGDRISRINERTNRGNARLLDRVSALDRRRLGIDEQVDTSETRLRFNEMKSMMNMFDVSAKVKQNVAILKTKDYYKDEEDPAVKKAMLARLNEPMRKAETANLFAQYRAAAFSSTSPEQLEGLKSQYAQSISERFFQGREKEFSPAQRDAFANQMSQSLPTPSGGRISANRKVAEIEADRQKLVQEQAAIEEKAEREKDRIRSKYQQSRVKNEDKLNAELDAIEQKRNSLSQKNADARTAAEEKVARARRKFALEDAAEGGRRGSGGGGESGSGSRNAFDLGIGLASVAAYSVALRELTIDTAQYASRTEQLKLTTEQMAKANYLNVDATKAYAAAVVKENVTTQDSERLIQKLTQAQLDISKAPKLTQVAQNLSVLSGTDPSEALDRIMMGVVTGQTRILHQAGLQVSANSVNRGLRQTLGREPSDFEKRQGLLDAVLVEGARTMGVYDQSLTSAAGQFSLLSRQVQETKNAIGNQFLPEYSRMIQIITSGLKTVEQHPEGASKVISGGLGLGTALGTLGTISFAKYAGSLLMKALPRAASVEGVAAGVLGTGLSGGAVAALGTAVAAGGLTYYLSQGDDRKLAIQQAQKSRELVLEKQRSLQDTALAAPGASPDEQLQRKFNHDYYVAASKATADQLVTIQKQLTQKLAQQYDEQVTDYDDMVDKMSGKQGFWAGVIARSERFLQLGTKGAFIPGAKPEVQGVPELGITADQIKKQRDAIASDRNRQMSLDPTVAREMVQRASDSALIQDMASQADSLQKKFDPGGQLSKERIRRVDTPRQKLYDELTDFKLALKDVEPALERHKAEYDRTGRTNEPLAASITLGEEVVRNHEKLLSEKQAEISAELGKIERQTKLEVAKQNESVFSAVLKNRVIPGNRESETAGIEAMFKFQTSSAEQQFQLHQDPDIRTKQLAAIQAQRQVGLVDLSGKEEAFKRSRGTFLATDAASFAATNIMNDPRLSLQQALTAAANEELKATKSIYDDDRRREAVLQILVRLRNDSVEAARQEAKLSAEVDISKFGNQVSLGRTIGRIQAGRGGRTEDDQALMEIEAERQASLREAQFAFDKRRSVATPAEQSKLRADRDAQVDSINTRSTEATLQQLDRQVQARRQGVVASYQEQFQKIQQINELTVTNPAEEVSSIKATFDLRMQYINKEFEARGRTIDAEKDKRKQVIEAEFDELKRILELQRQRREEARNFSGSLFEAGLQGGQAVPQFLKSFFQNQAKTIVQNAATGPIESVFNRVSNSLPGQFGADGKPTALGKILGGTIFGSIKTDDPAKLLADVTRQSTDAEQELTIAVKSLDDAIRSATGQASSGGSSGNAGGVTGGLSSLSSIGNVFGLPSLGLPNTSGGSSGGGLFSGGTGLVQHLLGSTAGGSSGSLLSTIAAVTSLGIPLAASSINSSPGLDSLPTLMPTYQASSDAMHSNVMREGTTSGLAKGLGAFTSSLGSSKGVQDLMKNGFKGNMARGIGDALGTAATVIGGAETAISGFHEGGARGGIQGAAGILAAASVIPGPQQPFIAAAAATLALVHSLFPDPKVVRQRQIDKYLQNAKYQAPVTINREISAQGGSLVGTDLMGLSRSTGIAGFPIPMTPNSRRLSSVQDTPGELTFIDQPGRVLPPGSGAQGAAGPYAGSGSYVSPSAVSSTPQIPNVSLAVHLPVSAMDSQDIMRRSPDIAAAVAKELKGGGGRGDLAYYVNQTVFGAG